jgi:RNA polymerase sigma-70 factor (ECF subfamily)
MDLKKLTDAELVKLYQDGNEKCLEVLISRHQGKVFGYIKKSIKDQDEAEDVFQDTFIKVVHKLKEKQYVEEGKFLKWLLRITHNMIMDFFRASQKVSFARSTDEYNIFDTLDLTEENSQDKLMRLQLMQQLKGLIKHLPEDQQEIIKFRLYDELSFKEIAGQLNISLNTALGRMRYAVINMRKLIEKHQIELMV